MQPYHPLSEGTLLLGAPAEWLHLSNQFTRAQVGCRVAVAIEAKLHREGFGAHGERHLVDASVAFHASDPAIDMDRVIELHIVGKLRHSVPAYRLTGRLALPHRFKNFSVRPDLGMAGHASMCGRKTSLWTFFHAGVTVTAINPVIEDVMLVAERNRLLTHPSDLGLVTGSRIIPASQRQTEHRHRQHHRAQAYPRIRGWRKDLRERPPFSAMSAMCLGMHRGPLQFLSYAAQLQKER